MLAQLLIIFLLVTLCVVIHGLGTVFGLRWLATTRPLHHHFSMPSMFWILIRVVYGLLLLHLLQILVWAVYSQIHGGFPDFFTAFYYCASSYSPVGYGDVVPLGRLRLMGAVEAVTGILMFGWGTGLLFSLVNHLQGRFHGQQPPNVLLEGSMAKHPTKI
jgi:Ion channel